ncbi:ClpA/ClpB-like protein [Kribbella sp. VKM Ac-2527]|uniref:ClpA/ClpB-like protein n=1 Tax=Kribbella caucasensis TaxID=2512215 RepID=A0A4R6KH57_9ACTN|nr:ClpA/ClpB-like protein [Kribbella sp. VKM Ac-2527]
MVHLDLYDVLAVAARVLRIDAGAVVRSTDLDAIDRALTAARAHNPGEVPEAAAVLFVGLVREQPFERDNRLVALAVLLQFLGLNGFDLRLEPGADLDDLFDRVADGRFGRWEIADFIRSVLSERSRPVWFEAVGDKEDAMFELFSDSARRAIVLAQEEARLLSHNYVGTEHILLGLIDEGGTAAKHLAEAGITAAAVRTVVLEIIGPGQTAPGDHLPFTPRTKRVLELTRTQARILGSEEFRPEHILLGLIAEGKGVAAQALAKLGADPVRLRRQITAETDLRQRTEDAVHGFLTEDAEHSGTYARSPHIRHRHLVTELTALLDENERLHSETADLREESTRLRKEVTRLRAKLRTHDIDPDT